MLKEIKIRTTYHSKIVYKNCLHIKILMDNIIIIYINDKSIVKEVRYNLGKIETINIKTQRSK